MILEKALEKCGLSIEADALPKKQRTVKVFQRLIAAMRAAEAEVISQLSESERSLNEQLRANLGLQERLQNCDVELRRYKVRERLGEIEALTTADRQKLLEVA